jgi:hypothetical protein
MNFIATARRAATKRQSRSIFHSKTPRKRAEEGWTEQKTNRFAHVQKSFAETARFQQIVLQSKAVGPSRELL